MLDLVIDSSNPSATKGGERETETETEIGRGYFEPVTHEEAWWGNARLAGAPPLSSPVSWELQIPQDLRVAPAFGVGS
jgi:hypothetical protein